MILPLKMPFTSSVCSKNPRAIDSMSSGFSAMNFAPASARELEEECGVISGNVFELGKIYPTPGYCSEIIHIYGAANLKPSKQALDEGEFLACKKYFILFTVKHIGNALPCFYYRFGCLNTKIVQA